MIGRRGNNAINYQTNVDRQAFEGEVSYDTRRWSTMGQGRSWK
jgi:hypothetical protein